MTERGRLTPEELAAEAETTPERVARLAEIHAIRRGDDGRFDRGDVVRLRLLDAFEAEGVSLDHVALGIRERAITLDFIDLFYPDPSPLTGRSFAAFAASLGPRGHLLNPAIVAMGLPAPRPDAPTRVAEEAVLTELLGAWGGVDEMFTLRAARIFGDSVRRAAEGWVALFDEAIGRPSGTEVQTIDDLVPRIVEPAIRIRNLSDVLLRWLLERHLERTMNELNAEALERELIRRGVTPAAPAHPPAIAFVDVTNYTGLTEQQGDELAARTAVRLGELAEDAVRPHGGRVVKLLGDGVLLAFEESRAAVAASLELAAAMEAAGLPPAHGGVHAGPVIQRDNDVYGATVITAARIATRARPGEILVSDIVRAECADTPELEFDPYGETELKGISGSVLLFEVRRGRTLHA